MAFGVAKIEKLDKLFRGMAMVLPWNRSDDEPTETTSERRRRRRSARNRSQDSRDQSTQRSYERKRQRIAMTVGTILIMAIVAIVAVGYYREFYNPPRVTAGAIRGEEFSMGDLVERIRVIQGINRYQGGKVDLSVVPFEYLQGLLNAEILRQAAPSIGIYVTKENVDEAIKGRFYPVAPAGQETDPGQLDLEFESNYQNFLTQVNLSDDVYRRIVEEGLQRQQLALFLARDIPESIEQVEIEWIRLEFDGPVQADDVRTRLQSEDFQQVAADVNASGGFADSDGYVGWVPEGAFPDFDKLLFATDQGDALLKVGGISDPQFTGEDGIFIIHKLSDLTEKELSPLMLYKLTTEMVKGWQEAQLTQGSSDGWLEINFDSDRYAWVADQVRLTAPRVPKPPPQNQGMPIRTGG